MWIYNNHFGSIWISNDNSFNQAKEELKLNFKVVDIGIYDKLVKSFVKHDYDPKKVQPSITNIFIYDLGTYNEDRAIA